MKKNFIKLIAALMLLVFLSMAVSCNKPKITQTSLSVDKYDFESPINKISSAIIYGPSIVYDNKIIFSNCENSNNIDEYNYGILYIDNGKIDKYINNDPINEIYKTNTEIWFSYFSYEMDTSSISPIKFDLKSKSFSKDKNISIDALFYNLREVSNDQYTWFIKWDKGIEQIDTNGISTMYKFTDLEEENWINNLYITEKCLWANWGGEGSLAGVSYMDLDTKKWQHFLGYSEEERTDIPHLLDGYCGWSRVDSNGDLYAYCYKDREIIVRYNYAKLKWEEFYEISDGNGPPANLLFLKKYVIINTADDVIIINKDSKSVQKKYLENYNIYEILLDEDKTTLYFCTDKGVYSQKVTD